MIGVVFEIDGQTITLKYSAYDSNRCSDYWDCLGVGYTRRLSLELADGEPVELSNYAGNNAIVDRYALVWRQPRGTSELLDLTTGTSIAVQTNRDGRVDLQGIAARIATRIDPD